MSKNKNVCKMLLILGLVLIMAITVVGCGAEKENKSEVEEQTVPEINYPEKPVKFIVTHPAGGSTDLPIRVIAPFVEKELGQPVAIENLVGGGGNTARAFVFNAKPDGYTILVSKQPSMMVGELGSGADYKSMEFEPVYNIDGGEYNVVAVKADGPYETFEDLVEASQKSSLKVGASGVGTNGHLAALLLMNSANVKIDYIPFEGVQAVPALLGGHVDASTNAAQSFITQVEDGDVRFLATLGPNRMEKYPDVPTMAELGYPQAQFDVMTGVYAPPGTPKEIIDILADAFEKAHNNAEFKKAAQGVIAPLPLNPEELGKELESYNKFVTELGDLLAPKN